jgi:hypothetical protein
MGEPNDFPDHFDSFEQFYPFYLKEHRTQMCKYMHFMGTCLLVATFFGIIITGHWSQWWLLPVFGYGFAWGGHFIFEKNRPATFKAPLYSLRADFTMFYHLLKGYLAFETDAELR